MRAPRFSYPTGLALAALLFAATAIAEVPIVTDSRIKTLVYNPNEVFAVTTHYGYQSNIEFSEKENIETVSVGDRVAWQIIPAGRRLFIRAMEENATTNMTVVTNLHAYQFDLRSSSADAVFGSEELTYVVRFFYPGEQSGMIPAIYTAPPPAPVAAMEPVRSMPMTPAMPVSTGSVPSAPNGSYNYRYTFSGPSTVAPVKIYDDGRSTYFKFRGSVPQFAVISAKGEELAIPSRSVGPGMVAVDTVASRFSLRASGSQVIVYNEMNGA